MKGDIEAV